ncbi:hypothetical protein [Streptomyces sp. NPDC006290]|uniref:hypothetical protein n=1 Tax=unclassified Streptomyces TaxID=2593676 RepID=UPI0033BBC42D
MKLTKRRTQALYALLGALGLVLVTANSAAAVEAYGAYEGGGYGVWMQDPGYDELDDPAPGDAIKACDIKADGWGIEVKLDINRDGSYERTISTRGHASPYCSGWDSGNIAENTPIRMKVTKVNGDTSYHPVYWDGHS